MTEPIKTRRGVYIDLEKSPYGYLTPYGDLYKFSSQKRLEIYRRDIIKELARADKLFERHELYGFLPDESLDLIRRAIFKAFYNKVEG